MKSQTGHRPSGYSSYYGAYLHSQEWYRRRKRAFAIWNLFGWWLIMGSNRHANDGHHWLGYKNLGHEHFWDIMRVSRRINNTEKWIRVWFFHSKSRLGYAIRTWLSIFIWRPWLWVVPVFLLWKVGPHRDWASAEPWLRRLVLYGGMLLIQGGHLLVHLFQGLLR